MTFGRSTPSWLLLLFILGSQATPAAGQSLVRGPYLQLLSTRSVTVVWRTDAAVACSLALTPPGGPPRIVTGDAGETCEIQLGDLAPGTRYRYVPRANGNPLGEESSFETDAPALPSTFLVVGDHGTNVRTAQAAVRDRMLEIPADFVLSTGDMIYPEGAAEDFDPKFFAPYAALLRRMVFWPCLGNHDLEADDGDSWRAAFYTPANNAARDEGYYSFDHGAAHVVVLDSNRSLDPDSAQHAFLDRDLAGSAARWKFAAFHHTIYSSSSHGSAAGLRESLVPLFDRHHVDVVFMGHDHDYERTVPLRGDAMVAAGEGTVYITTGGGGADVYPAERSSFTAYSEASHHVVRVDLDGGRLQARMIRADGEVRDTLEIVKSGGGGGCLAAVAQALARSDGVEACADQTVPRRIARLHRRASTLAARAARTAGARRAARLADRAEEKLGRAAGIAERAGLNGRLSPACAAELSAALDSARSACQSLRAHIPVPVARSDRLRRNSPA